MEALEKIKVRKSNGELAEAEVLLCFELEDTGKKYILYTFNEVDEQAMETVPWNRYLLPSERCPFGG